MKLMTNTLLLLNIVCFITLSGLLFANPLLAQTIVNDGYGDYLFVPAGEFLMGDNYNEGPSCERPVHTVYLDAYYIGKYEMTNGEYKKFIDDGGYSDSTYWTAEGFGKYGSQPQYWDVSTHRGGGIPGNEMFPVVGVCKYEAEAYCKWLSAKTEKKYRLPTEAEWEKAARGTDQRRYPWGDNIDSSYANYYKSNDPYEDAQGPLGGFTPVGYYNGNTYGEFSTHDNASPYGAYDMTGNVFELCSDQYGDSYYSNSPVNNPTGPSVGEYIPYGSTSPVTGDFATIRGGFWTDNNREMVMSTLRCACRSLIPEGSGHRKSRGGFRCIREVDEGTSINEAESRYIIPKNYYLFQNYPNPLNSSTTIKYNLQKPSNVILNIYNISGQELETLVSGFKEVGVHDVIWRPEGLPLGIYFYKIQTDEYNETKKLIIQK